LSKEEIKRIADIELEPIYQRLAQHRINLELTQKAKDYLCEKGFDMRFGARPLKQTIQKYIQAPLSVRLLDGSLKKGRKITVDIDADKNLVFK
jgi:ATP-dependent Clp protease ATP-binding subunit ClpA